MMSIDSYVRRVRFWLPGARGRVAAEEVRSALEEIITARADGLGRPLRADEVARELRAFGRPQVVATRYASTRPLVDAGLMPSYLRVLGISSVGVILAQLLLLILAPEADIGRTLTAAGGRAATGLLLGFASITLTFAVLTRMYAPQASRRD
jgi:hypothetical protein